MKEKNLIQHQEQETMAKFGREYVIIFIVLVLLVGSSQTSSAARILYGDQWKPRLNDRVLALQALPKGPVTPSTPSGCTNDPNNTSGSCPWATAMASACLCKLMHARKCSGCVFSFFLLIYLCCVSYMFKLISSLIGEVWAIDWLICVYIIIEHENVHWSFSIFFFQV